MVPAPNWSSSTSLFFPLWATLYDEFMKKYLRVFTATISEFERKQQHVEYWKAKGYIWPWWDDWEEVGMWTEGRTVLCVHVKKTNVKRLECYLHSEFSCVLRCFGENRTNNPVCYPIGMSLVNTGNTDPIKEDCKEPTIMKPWKHPGSVCVDEPLWHEMHHGMKIRSFCYTFELFVSHLLISLQPLLCWIPVAY